ncbi:UvrD-helicase domain-containing protein [candidate division TA06 bacterium]|nr:UvrD-helicase domain-containing protein [candidate division TA06 bacterium]
MPRKNEITPRHEFPQWLLIEASAGSGKTHALARRYVEYLLSADIAHRRPANLLAITFTKNAAREMKERILAWLKELALSADSEKLAQIRPLLGIEDQEIKVLAGDMVGQIITGYSDFQVQTIDSFTNRLARASARELGFRPDFKVAMSYGQLLDFALALLSARTGPGRDRELTGAMGEFLKQLNEGGGAFAWDPQPRMREKFQAFLKVEAKETGRFEFPGRTEDIESCLKELQEIYDEVEQTGISHGLSVRPPDAKLPELILERRIDDILKRESFHSKHTPLLKGKARGEQADVYQRSMAIWGRTGEIVARLAEARAVDKYSPYGLPYGHFKKFLMEAKLRQGTYHLDDICQQLSSFISRQNIPEIYLKLGARIHHYLVDEFQDTDPAQWRSLQPLLEEAMASDGSAFLVGDLKQAIYMFRQADYRTMKQIKQEILGELPRWMLPASVAESAKLESLPNNFRSGQVIVNYTAETFKTNLARLIKRGDYSADQTGLTSYEQEPIAEKLDQGYVEVRHFPVPSQPGPEEEGGQLEEPLRVALLEIVGDALKRGHRPQDIAVLAGSNDELEQALDWLTQAGIQATSSSGQDIRRRRVVAELLELLGWLDSPIDNLAWAGVVRGELLLRAASADGLAWDRARADALLVAAGQRSAGAGNLYTSCQEDRDFLPLWERYFREPFQLAGFLPAYDLVCLAMERLKAFDNFPDEAGSLMRLLEAVNRQEAEGSSSLSDFLEAIRNGDDSQFQMELPGELPAVRIMTYYKAKGLGFPLVVNLFRQTGKKRADMYFRKNEGRIVMYGLTEPIAACTAGYPQDLGPLKAEFDLKYEAQELNCLYVACTRAVSELYNLVSFPQPKDDGQTAAYAGLFPAGKKGSKANGPAVAKSKEPLTPRTGCAPLPLEKGSKPAWTASRYQEARLGEYLHRVLEDIEFLPPDPRQLVKELLLRHGPMPAGTGLTNLAEDLLFLLSQPEILPWFTLKPGRTVHREAEFVDSAGRLVRMDRVVCDPETVTVLDFKTGREILAGSQAHQVQMSGYLRTLGQAFPGKALGGLIVYRDGTVLEVRL